MSCLIIGNHTQGLGIIRSLFQCAPETHLLNEKLISLSRYSKHLTKYHFIKRNTLRDLYLRKCSDYLINFISRLVPKNDRWVVLGINEDIVHFLYENREILMDRLLIPENDIQLVIDKFKFTHEIRNLGLNCPKTYLLKDFDENLFKQGGYVCKGRRGNKFRSISNKKGWDIQRKADLKTLKDYIKGIIDEDEVILQKKLKDNREVLSCCGLSIDGEIYKLFQYVKLRQHPDEYGTGTFLKSISDPVIYDLSLSIIKHFVYTGIFEIEFIQDFRGDYHVIEMNPRTWKSINFATDCGQNICAAYYNYMKHSMIPEKCLDYAIGKTWVDLGTDIPMLLKNRWLNNIGYDRNTYFCVMNHQDPLPFLMEIILAPLIAIGV